MILMIKHARTEGPGTLGEFFKATSWEIRVTELWNKALLPRINDCEAIISLGGPMNVYETEKYSFLKKEEEFLIKALEKNIPILGICLGAQLLAKASGAKVIKAKHKEIGWYEVKLTTEGKQDPLFRNMVKNLEVFQWHEDSFGVPKQAELLATSGTCKNQAIRVGKNAWGLQYHPEMTAEMINCWFGKKENSAKDKALLDYYQKRNLYEAQARLMYFNFSRIIAG
ncbi:MAG: type 1 glutamine amidotransferase [Candidatus Omnitrophota bacterium]